MPATRSNPSHADWYPGSQPAIGKRDRQLLCTTVIRSRANATCINARHRLLSTASLALDHLPVVAEELAELNDRVPVGRQNVLCVGQVVAQLLPLLDGFLGPPAGGENRVFANL